MKKTWKGIKDIINLSNKSGDQITKLNQNGKIIDNDYEMANTFNNYFTNIGPQLDKNIPQSQRLNFQSHYLKNRKNLSFNFSYNLGRNYGCNR